MNKDNVASPQKSSKLRSNLADIADNYNIQEIIGEGTFGKVKSAIHILTGEKV